MMNNSLTRVPIWSSWVNRSAATVALLCALILFTAAAAADTIATDPNSLLVGPTSYDLRDYENLYDSAGNVVTNRMAQAGDSIQGVFVITNVANVPGEPVYSPASGNSAVEITGVFDEYVAGVDSKGNYIVTPDSTTTIGSKAMSGSGFQTAYGTNSLLAVYYNNNNAMPVTKNGSGLNGLTTAAQAFALATTGTEWASFGAMNTSGGTTGWGASNGYFWAFNQTGVGVASFAASLGMIQNYTAYPTSEYAPVPQNSPNPPAGGVDTNINGTGSLSNIFAIQGTTNTPANNTWMGSETVYGIGSTDPAQLNLVPEPCSFALAGAIFVTVFLLRCGRRMLGR
jgi:hypothetical protein